MNICNTIASAVLQMGQADRVLVELGSDSLPQLCQRNCVGPIVLRYIIAILLYILQAYMVV
jgi:hypothetical protein